VDTRLQFKKVAEEKIKADRAKYKAHLEKLQSEDVETGPPVKTETLDEAAAAAGVNDADEQDADKDFETPEVINQVKCQRHWSCDTFVAEFKF